MIRSLTIAIEDDLLLKARKVALDKRTTVNQMVRDYLAMVVDSNTHVHQTRSNLKPAFKAGIADAVPITWSREDLHDR